MEAVCTVLVLAPATHDTEINTTRSPATVARSDIVWFWFNVLLL